MGWSIQSVLFVVGGSLGARLGDKSKTYFSPEFSVGVWIWIILDDVYADFCRGAGSV